MKINLPDISGRASAFVNLGLFIVSGLIGTASQFTTIFGAGPTAKIMAGIGIGGVILTAVNGYLHAAGGGGIAPPAPHA